MQKPAEPDKSKPCWVLVYTGASKDKKVMRVRLREYAWSGYTWRRTDTPEEYPSSLYAALAKADWWGRLPEQGRKKTSLTQANLDKAAPLFASGASIRAVSRELGIGMGTAHKLQKLWKRTVYAV